MNSTTIAVDVAKSVFEVAVSEYPGQVRERHRLSRGRFSRFLAEHPPATVVMEACGSAHHWAREAQSRGHRVILVPPHTARPYVLRNKTDRTDAKGLLEAFRNDALRPVPVKSETQQALAALHRLRSTWVATRTARKADRETTGDVRYLTDGLHPTWAPDGLSIAYAAGKELREIGPDGGPPRTIASALGYVAQDDRQRGW